jgi:hypothetical protein
VSYPVIAQERVPALSARRQRPMACSHVPLERAFRDVNPKLEQLAANSISSPEPILSAHALNELDDVGREARRRRLRRLGRPAPKQAKALAVQRRTVSGVTSSRASRHLGSAAASSVIRARSWRRKIGRFTRRAATMSCWRSKTFSATNSACERRRSAARPPRIEQGSGRRASQTAFAVALKARRNLSTTCPSTRPICAETTHNFKPLSWVKSSTILGRRSEVARTAHEGECELVLAVLELLLRDGFLWVTPASVASPFYEQYAVEVIKLKPQVVSHFWALETVPVQVTAQKQKLPSAPVTRQY